MVELVDTIDLESITVRFESSSLSLGTKKINFVISNKNSTFDIIKYMGGSFSGKTIDSDSVNDGSTPSPSTNFIVKQKKRFRYGVL